MKELSVSYSEIQAMTMQEIDQLYNSLILVNKMEMSGAKKDKKEEINNEGELLQRLKQLK